MHCELLDHKKVGPNFLPAIYINRTDVNRFQDVTLTLCDRGYLLHANKACQDLFGYCFDEIEGLRYSDLVLPEDRNTLRDVIRVLKRDACMTNFVSRCLKKDGSVLHISWSPYWFEKEKIIYLVGHQITQLLSAPQKQAVKDHLFQTLIENSFDLLTFTDENGKFLYVSESLKKYYRNPDDLLGTNCFDYMHPDDLPRLMEQFKGLMLHDKKIQVPPYRFKNAEGEWIWMEAIVTNQLNNPDIKGVVVSVRDIHQQVTAEMKLKEMALLQALMEGEEKERSRIARDLHDGVSGMIAAAKMHFSAMSERSACALESKEYIQGMDLLEKAALQVRRTSHNLMPEVLLENGLDEALSIYCRNISSDHLAVEFLTIGEISRYSTSFELSLYRIAQELISNVVKHSKANEALVQLSQQANILSLTVEDNGSGFCKNFESKGTGLMSVRRRVEALGGFMELDGEAGKGTHIYIEFEK